MTEAAAIIKEVGFPIFVAGYLLVRSEALLREVKETNANILSLLREVMDKIK